MPGQLPISLLSALAWGKLASALVPADPTITSPALLPRQNGDRFIGWVETDGTWYSQDCNAGLTWYQDGKYAQCCPTTLAHCYAPTACVDGSLIYPYSDQGVTTTIACTDNFDNPAYSICNTAFIFENFDDSNAKTDIVCGESSVNWSYYRKIPASVTEASTSVDPTSTPDGVAGPSSPNGPRPTTQPEKKESKAWIAGAVIGPLAGLAIIGAIVFFLMRRKKSKQQQAIAPTVGTVGGQPPVQQYTDAKPVFSPQGSYGQPSPGYPPNDQYNQQGYGQAPLSPAPQYQAPYSPPPEGIFAPEKQTQHPEPSQAGAVELGGSSSPAVAAPQSFAAELSGETTRKPT